MIDQLIVLYILCIHKQPDIEVYQIFVSSRDTGQVAAELPPHRACPDKLNIWNIKKHVLSSKCNKLGLGRQKEEGAKTS